jgi:hypothetical protein
MNRDALSRTVRSLYFRRRLTQAIPTLEATVKAELSSRGLTTALVKGFFVRFDGKDLSIQPTLVVHPGQLWLPGTRSNLPTELSLSEH